MTGRFVCLMYHQVLPHEPGANAGDYFAVSRAMFGRHLDAVRAEGFAGVSLATALESRARPRIAITFDDGTIDHVEHALPELLARDMTATFFVTTSWVGQSGYASWEQLRSMRDAGMEIGSHSRSHPFLSELTRADLWDELVTSRHEIDRQLGGTTRTLALPGGDFPRRDARELVLEAGYTVVATSRWGRNGDRDDARVRFVRRCTVHGRVPDAEFRRIVRGDAALGLRRMVRENVLSVTRTALGPSRYTRLRRKVLSFLER